MVQFYSRVGAEFGVDSETAGNQGSPTIAYLAGGGFVISWYDNGSADGDGSGGCIRARMFNAAGLPVGDAFLVNSTTANGQQDPAVTSLASGGFVVTWMDSSGEGGDASGWSIKAQMFDATGAPIGGEFLVNAVTDGGQAEPTISSLASGGFVVTWLQMDPQGDDLSGYAVKAQIFDAAGAKVGSELLVNTATLVHQSGSVVTPLESGGFVVAWMDGSGVGGDADGVGIKAQLFDAGGAKVGGELLVNTTTSLHQSSPSIATLSTGGFVVTWTDQSMTGGDASGSSVKAQIFDADGNRVGGEFLVNGLTVSSQSGSTVAPLPDGGFIVSWSDSSGEGGDTSGSGVRAQIFDASGNKVGAEFLLNMETQGNQSSAVIAPMDGGDLAISWYDGTNIVRAQVLAADDPGPSGVIFSASSVSETAIQNFSIGTLSSLGRVDSTFTYSLLSDSTGGAFRIDGNRLVVQDNSRLDFETAPEVTLVIRTTDDSGNHYDQEVTIAVTDVQGEVRLSAGDEILVNTETVNSQYDSTITALATGGFVVSWTDESGQGGDSSSTSIKAQIFDAAGAKVGAEFLINTATVSEQSQPTITALASGGFVVSWMDWSTAGGDTWNSGIKAQIFDAAGNQVGSEFLVNTETDSTQYSPSITSLSSGGFLISWSDLSGQGGDASGSSVKAQLFDSSGTKVGSEFLVNTTTLSSQQFVDITALASGGFIATWEDSSGGGGDASGTGIKAQIFGATGNKIGGEFIVNSVTSDLQTGAVVTALASGGFVVSWMDRSLEDDPSNFGIKAQIFDANGAMVGEEFLVNTITANTQFAPTIAALPSGGFVVGWTDQSLQDDTSSYGVKAQIFDSTGTKVGGEFLVNTETSSQQERPTITALPSGGFVVSWTDLSGQGGDASSFAVKAKMFVPVTAPSGQDKTIELAEDGGHVFTGEDFGFSDPDAGDAFAGVVITTLPAGGALLLDGAEVTAGAVISAADIDQGLLTFEPGANDNGVGYSSFTFQVRDDSGVADGGDTDQTPNTLSFDVSAVNDAPTVGGDGTESLPDMLEDQSILVGNALTVGEIFGGQFSDAADGAADSLVAVAVVGNGSSSAVGQWQYWDGATWKNIGVVSESSAKVLIAVARLRFDPADDYDGPAPDLTVRLIESSSTAVTNNSTLNVIAEGTGGESRISAETVTLGQTVLPVNDAPSGSGGTVIVAEDGAYTFTTTDYGFSDGDGDALAGVVIGNLPENGSLLLDGVAVLAGVEISAADIDAGLLTYEPGADAFGAAYASFSFQLRDDGGTADAGSDLSVAGTIMVEVTAENDAAVLDLNGAGEGVDATATYTENSASGVLAPDLLLSDLDDTMLEGATIAISGGFAPGDFLTVNGATSGTLSGIAFSYDGSTGVLTLSGSASLADYQAVLRQLGFESTSDAPGTSRTLTWTIDDGNVESAAATTTITIGESDDGPVLSVADNDVAGIEDHDLVFSSAKGNAITVSDPDSSTLTVTVSVASGVLTLAQSTGLSFTTGDGAGDAAMTFSGSAADINAALEGLIYRGGLDYEGPDSLSVEVGDGNTGDSGIIAISLADDNFTNGEGGDDDIGGTDGNDRFNLSQGGDDDASGGTGRDVFYYGGALTDADSNDGGDAGGDPRGDLLVLQGDYTITLGAETLVGIEKLRVLRGTNTQFGYEGGGTFNYNITTVDANVASGGLLVVQGGSLQVGESLTFDGSAETDGRFQIFGGRDTDDLTGGSGDDHLLGRAGDDHLVSNDGNDRLRGGTGNDELDGGEGADTFIYAALPNHATDPYTNAALESTSLDYDTIIGFDFAEDRIDLPQAVTSLGQLLAGSLSTATFDADLAAAVDGLLDVNGALLFTADAGDQAGETFLIVDGDGNGSYEANLDYVIHLDAPVGTVPTTPADMFV